LPSIAWLRALAPTYLGLFTVRRTAGSGLQGYYFERRERGARVGFFLGFLTVHGSRFTFLKAEPPECLAFAFLESRSRALSERIIRQPDSLFRQTYHFLFKYSHSLPRFEFYEDEAAAIVRHVPLGSFPAGQRHRYARNFFVESLALFVRTRLPDYLRAVDLSAAEARTLAAS